MVTRLLTAAPGGGNERVVTGVVALHGRCCLWSSLPRDDSAAVYRFAATALVPLLKKPPSALRVLARTARARSVPAPSLLWSLHVMTVTMTARAAAIASLLSPQVDPRVVRRCESSLWLSSDC